MCLLQPRLLGTALLLHSIIITVASGQLSRVHTSSSPATANFELLDLPEAPEGTDIYSSVLDPAEGDTQYEQRRTRTKRATQGWEITGHDRGQFSHQFKPEVLPVAAYDAFASLVRRAVLAIEPDRQLTIYHVTGHRETYHLGAGLHVGVVYARGEDDPIPPASGPTGIGELADELAKMAEDGLLFAEATFGGHEPRISYECYVHINHAIWEVNEQLAPPPPNPPRMVSPDVAQRAGSLLGSYIPQLLFNNDPAKIKTLTLRLSEESGDPSIDSGWVIEMELEEPERGPRLPNSLGVGIFGPNLAQGSETQMLTGQVWASAATIWTGHIFRFQLRMQSDPIPLENTKEEMLRKSRDRRIAHFRARGREGEIPLSVEVV
ncbi:MAG: hypothetical protein M1837_007379 [Sclerophora amabilis]|nr:MAG: hypothetical protein M1837_007379 [Sclerophora amabilis]